MKKLYFKKWIQNILIGFEVVLFILFCSISDSLEAPIVLYIIIGLLIAIIGLLLVKYGKFEEKEDEE